MNKVGLIAGNGKLPELFLRQCQKKGMEVFSVYLFDSVEESIKLYENSIKYSVAQPGKIISYFKKNGLSHIVMLGKVEKNLIFSNLKFDFTATKILLSAKNKKDKNILKAVINYIESENITVLPQNYLLDDYIVKEINYTKIFPTANDQKTVKIGIEAAKVLTDIDAGQTVVAKDESVVALEGIEGTDKTILRAGEFAGKNCIVVKMARKNQDYRIDIPTIGLETIKKVVEIKAKGIIIEANKMLFIDQKQVIDYANKNKIFIKGIKYE
ncbi:LpxI family protein [Leptotrichia sp. OH3620_COT-345]|uniref:LpxI family protein n=1 Tax=Leptotrichia sp. OH3620_COT-345 TaxID=2491048 RepID=UPI000F64A5EF|nr:UDP-2,3-diacylglucosamine diphosphatase LpxI [Leptotrichia sp. OH3620_COT-345]RRD40196.1 LpxI family protein [Leptotrichia sp. OH3620_COT-345]